MNNNVFDDTLDIDDVLDIFDEDEEIDEQEFYLYFNTVYPNNNSKNKTLTDNRTWKSNVRDIVGGDNFADFCEEFFELLDEEEYFDN